MELEPLFEAIGFEAEMSPAMYSPPALGSMLERVPSQFLSGLGSANVADLSKRWAAAMSTSEHTHSIAGDRVSEGWKPEDALAILRPLADLAHKAQPAQQMFLLIET